MWAAATVWAVVTRYGGKRLRSRCQQEASDLTLLFARFKSYK